MKKIILNCLILIVFLFFCCIPKPEAGESQTTKAIKAAEEFLLLVDTSQYEQSWNVASSFFKNQVPKETWVKQISGLRPAFGKVISRQIHDAQVMTQLPGAPDGLYVVIRYQTTFENKRQATETITPMLDTDEQWRVSGYYIQ